jgi:hypothetical protein
MLHEPTPLPPVTTELAVLRILTEAHLRSLKPTARRRFMEELAAVLEEEDSPVLRLRPRDAHADVARARQHADAWIRRMVMFVAGK